MIELDREKNFKESKILVKNIPHTTDGNDLRAKFQGHNCSNNSTAL